MSNKALFYIIASPAGPYFPTGFKPVSLYADPRFVRAFPGGVGAYKVGSNYGPTVYVGMEAQKHGCQQVLWLIGKENLLTEAGTMNMFVVLKHDNDGWSISILDYLYNTTTHFFVCILL
jgi:branched-chain amino acid aminotransferase